MSSPILPFTGTKDRARIYLEVIVHRGKRWFATCNGFVASIKHPRTPDIVELAVSKAAKRAFRDYWDDFPASAIKVQIECEVRGFEYLASTEKLNAPLRSKHDARDGEACDHPGCLSHVTHPCEGCGRTAGRGVYRASRAHKYPV
jgi:hypothetical protein